MTTKDMLGPLGVFLIALPLFLLAGAVTYDATTRYDLAVSDKGKVVREQLLSQDANFLWPASDRVNENWDRSAGPLFAQYKLRMVFTLAIAPFVLGVTYLVCPSRIWPNYDGKRPDDLMRAAKGYSALGVLLLLSTIAITLRAPGYMGFTSCRSSSFENCVELQMLIPCLGIWGSTYLLWASIEFFALHRVEGEK